MGKPGADHDNISGKVCIGLGYLGPITRKVLSKKPFSIGMNEILKKIKNKIGGAKYEFLMRCASLAPHSRTGLHLSGVSRSHCSEGIEQKAIFQRK